MKRHMDCIGFEAPHNVVSTMSELLSQLQHTCPSNSYIDATVKKDRGAYNVAISIKYAEGEFSSRSSNVNLLQAVQESSNVITLQIQKWQKTRF